MKFFAWLQAWIRTAIAASSRKEFYRRIEMRRLGEAAGHLALLVGFLWVLPFLIFFFIDASAAVRSTSDNLRTHVPAGTVFHMKDGMFGSTMPEALVFGDKDYKVIINDASGTAALAEGERGLIINATGIAQHDAYRNQTISFKKVPDFRVTREELLQRIARWAPLMFFVGALLIGCLLFALGWIGFALSAFAHALTLFLALKIAKRPWDLKRACVASAYAATGPIALRAVLSAIGLPLGWIPNLLYWLILIWIAYDVIQRMPAVSGPQAPHSGATDGEPVLKNPAQ